MKKLKLGALLLAVLVCAASCQTAPPQVSDPVIGEVSAAPQPSASEAVSVPYTYALRAKLREDMPEYRFEAVGTAAGEGVGDWDTGFVTGLEVYDENDVPLLSEDFTKERPGNPIYLNMMDTMGLHVVDVNFDGYKDVIILNDFGGAHSNTWYDCWLWDAGTAAFVPSASFAAICNPALDQEEQCVYSSGGCGADCHEYTIYKVIDGAFIASNTLSWTHDGFVSLPGEEGMTPTGIQCTENRLVNGKMEAVRYGFFPNERAEVILAQYQSEAPWQLDSPRWYMLGGHHADKWLD